MRANKPNELPSSAVPAPAARILRRNLWIYGVGGILVPFAGIKLIDMLLVLTRLV